MSKPMNGGASEGGASMTTPLARRDVVARYKMSDRQLSYLIADGKFPEASFRIGNSPRWRIEDLLAFEESGVNGRSRGKRG